MFLYISIYISRPTHTHIRSCICALKKLNLLSPWKDAKIEGDIEILYQTKVGLLEQRSLRCLQRCAKNTLTRQQRKWYRK